LSTLLALSQGLVTALVLPGPGSAPVKDLGPAKEQHNSKAFCARVGRPHGPQGCMRACIGRSLHPSQSMCSPLRSTWCRGNCPKERSAANTVQARPLRPVKVHHPVLHRAQSLRAKGRCGCYRRACQGHSGTAGYPRLARLSSCPTQRRTPGAKTTRQRL